MADFDFLGSLEVGDDGLAGALFDLDSPLGVRIAAPTINVVAGDDNINIEDAADLIYITGQSLPEATIGLIWGDLTKTSRAGLSGLWSISVAPNELPPDGFTYVRVVAVDMSGNQSDETTRSVVVARTISNLPPAPILYAMRTGPSPRLIYGHARPNAIIHIRIDYENRIIVQADAFGEWRHYFEAIPGTYDIDVRQVVGGGESPWSDPAMLSVVFDVSGGENQPKDGSTADKQRIRRERPPAPESMPSMPTISAPFRTPKAMPVRA